MGFLVLSKFESDRIKEKVKYTINLEVLYKEIDKIPALTGAGVRYIDANLNIVELRPFEHVCLLNPVYIVLREPPKEYKAEEFSSYLKQNQENPRERNLVAEVSGAAISCAAAAIGWIVVFSSAAAVPVSGGASAAITYLSYGAAIAGTAQCFNGLVRTGIEASGNGDFLDQLDRQEWYEYASYALDAISIAGATAASATAVKSIKIFKASTGRPYKDILKGLSRSERRRLTLDIIRVNNPKVSNQALKAMIRSGNYPKRYLSSEIRNAYALKVKDAVGASLSFGGSISSGGINSIAVGIWEGIEE